MAVRIHTKDAKLSSRVSISSEPLELPDDGRRYIDEDTDWNYAPLDGEDTANHKPCTTISDFMTAYAH